jgi:hypothetical protein
MKDAMEIAREAGAHPSHNPDLWDIWEVSDVALNRLVELARADQDEKYKWDVHSCGPTCKRYACVAIREAVEAEREACLNCYSPDDTATDWADKIRARGNT